MHLGTIDHHDIQDSIYAFCILAGSWISNHLDAFHHRGRHRLQYFLGILRQTGVQMAVLIDFEAIVPLYEDVILTINSHHRHLAQHVDHSLGF